MTIRVDNCSKHYPQPRGGAPVPVVEECSFVVERHEFVALLGPSGCGKTTLLRMLAGLTDWDRGDVSIDGRTVSGPGRERAVVFQNFALLPWASVVRNIAFGLEIRGVARTEREARAMELAATVGLTGFEHHFPGQLSGGMQQRVGLARALAVNPRVLLMDEPFGALDAQTRRFMQEDLMRLQAADAKTVVFVTHDLDEAVRLADRVIVLSGRPGRVFETVTVPRDGRAGGIDGETPRLVELRQHLWDILRRLHDGAGS